MNAILNHLKIGRERTAYYLFATNRRKMLDRLLRMHVELYRGVVLDIGGRDRGAFRSPKEKVDRWIIADIESIRRPDILLDVCDMNGIQDESIDVINALELFEHVREPERGLSECFRVLKQGGTCIISMPFLYPVHADPHDFQRWTAHKWKYELQKIGFHIDTLEPMGRYFSVLVDFLKYGNRSLGPLQYIGFLVYPLLDLFMALDTIPAIASGKILGKFTTGYFIIVKK
jgi:SAM-dependent methyltransferase